jgi:hypothetical protein
VCTKAAEVTMVPRHVVLFGVAFVVSSYILAADPDPKPAELFVGRWQGERTFTLKSTREGVKDEVFTRKVVFEFCKDGTFTFTEGDIPELKTRLPNSAKGSTVMGKYSFVKDTEIEMTGEVDGKKMTSRAKVAVTKEALSLTQVVDGKEAAPQQTFKRAKD